MNEVVIRANNLSKRYDLGLTGHLDLRSAIRSNLSRWWPSYRSTNTEKNTAFWALQALSFSIKRGESVGIIGNNGAGKSTLLKICAQISPPSSGSLEIEGRVASLLEVGTGFHAELTGRENIYLNGTILGMSRQEIKKKFEEIVEFSGVSEFLDTPVKRYSSGMAVRLAFSVAAHLEPEVLLVDEVLSVGDLAFQKKCIRKMDEVASSGRTILFVSHNMRTIKQLCSRGILLNAGRIVVDGSIDQAINAYVKQSAEAGSAQQQFALDEKKVVNIAEVSLHNDEGQQYQFQFGEPIQVCFKLKCHRKVRFSPIVGIETHDGIRLTIAKGLAVDFHLEMNAGTYAELSAVFTDLSLTPGKYRILLRVVEGKGHVLDQKINAIAFEVLEVPFKNTIPFSGGQGLIRSLPKWSVS
ncbi:MAG: ABC transporter ATP-binding protein [Bacteroidota bacterium]